MGKISKAKKDRQALRAQGAEEQRNNLDVTYDVSTFKGFFQELFKRIKDMDITGLGAQLAFFFLLSIFPLLIFMVTLLPYLNLSEEQVFGFVEDIAPAEIYSLIETTLFEIMASQNTGLLSFGILGTIWSASLGMNALIKSLNLSYEVGENRPIWLARGMAIIATVLMIFIIIVALVLPVFGQQIGVFFFSFFGLEEGFLTAWNALRFLITPIIIFIVCAIIYWLAPNVKLNITSVFAGAAFTSISWLALSYAFSIYVNNFGNFSAAYGSIGGIILMMLWLYLSAMLLMVGGQINAVIQGQKNMKKEKRPA